jgi:3',5'-cyclic AMP phosphodiesterase CpdA
VTRIAHLSDLHFGAADARVTAALAAELRHDQPDLVVISGDLTMGARPSEFRQARAFMDAVGVPTLAVPGNHDLTPYQLYERFITPYARWRRIIAAETEPVWRNDRVAVLGLNTARRFGLNPDWSRGRVTRRRLDALLARMAALPAQLVRVVVAHHPLIPPDTAPDTPLAGGATRALRALRRARVTLVLAGHLHHRYARLASADADAPLILQGGTATSSRLRGEPNAYNRVEIGADGGISVRVRIWDGSGWKTEDVLF